MSLPEPWPFMRPGFCSHPRPTCSPEQGLIIGPCVFLARHGSSGVRSGSVQGLPLMTCLGVGLGLEEL